MNSDASTTAPTTTTTPATATRWSLDPGHSAVGFSVRHLMITNVRGEFERFEASVVYDAARPEATSIDASIEVASLSTRESKRDADLRGPLFFDTENHPRITFVSRSARASSESGGGLEIVGDLTIRGIRREVTLSVRDISGVQVDMRGNARIGASASARIRRSEFGMTWNKALETGGVVVGDAVTITLEISLVQAP